MDILEVIALIGLCLSCIKLGYMLGKNAKKITAQLDQKQRLFFKP